MRVRVKTVLDAPAQWVWEMAQKPSTLQWVSWPVLTFTPIDVEEFPDLWQIETVQVRLRLFGVVPAGKQFIVPSMSAHGPDESGGACWLRDNGSGDIVRMWDHWIRLRSLGPSSTHYVDDVRVKAGVLTPLVGLFAHVFYRYRQWRWRRMITRCRDQIKPPV